MPSNGVGAYGLDNNNVSVASFLAATNNGAYYNYGQSTGYNANYPAANYSTSASQGYWPANLGAYWASPQQTSSGDAYATPNKSAKTSQLSSSRPPSSAFKKKVAVASKDTTVFDENSDLKERIRELEAQLGLDENPLPAKVMAIQKKRVFKENCATTENVKPDKCASTTTTTPVKVKSDPQAPTPSKLDTPIKYLNKHDRKWIQRYEELMAYQKCHGHNMVPSACVPLGPWVGRQRQEKKKGKMPQERIELLDAIDFVWAAN